MESSTSGEHENSKSNDEISNCEGTRWICPSCKLMLNDANQLGAHLLMATPGHSFDFDVPYSCPECAVPISQLNDLREHMSTHAPNAYQATPSTSNTNSPKKNVTPLVNKIAPPEDPSTKMMVANSPTIAEGIIPNNMVPKLLSGSQIIGNLSLLHGDPRKHKRRDLVATNRNARSKPMTAEKLLALSCMQCGLIFENRCKYTRHLLDHKMESTPYRCPMKGCMMSYDIKQKLRSHVQRKHPDISEASIELACVQGDSIFAPKTLANINVAAFLTQQKLLTESPPILQKTLQAKEELVEIDEENSSEAVDMSQLFANDSTTQIKAEENSDSKYTLLENGLLSRNGRKRKIPTQFSP
ncbi:unnamed protein product, partial [Mesorhabditis belari]|uniref:C2H2-type domain-containing protein n=1 Tax=Mesorhabditis belari TaxID=2138241 RepID=A0AAF3ERU5_9BILA